MKSALLSTSKTLNSNYLHQGLYKWYERNNFKKWLKRIIIRIHWNQTSVPLIYKIHNFFKIHIILNRTLLWLAAWNGKCCKSRWNEENTNFLQIKTCHILHSLLNVSCLRIIKHVWPCLLCLFSFIRVCEMWCGKNLKKSC